jgi:hypothetical protein
MRRTHYIVLESATILAAIALVSWKYRHPPPVKPAGEQSKSAARPPEVQIPKLTENQQLRSDFEAEFVKPAQDKFRISCRDDIPEARRRELWKEVVSMDENFRARVARLLDQPKYQTQEYEWLTDMLTAACQRLRVVRDQLKCTEPPVAAPPGGAK